MVLIVSFSTYVAIKYNILNIKFKNLRKFLNSSLIIFILLFFMKHSLRIYNNYNELVFNNAWPQFPKKEHTKDISEVVKIDGKFAYYLLKDKDGCGYTSSPCTPYLVKKNIYQKKINGYKFYLIK